MAVGTLWPKIFAGSSIKPKLDVLIFVVPAFARKWGTLGGRKIGPCLLKNVLNKIHF